jgi:hypothetical protein
MNLQMNLEPEQHIPILAPTTEEAPESTPEEVIKRLGSKDEEEREEAKTALFIMGSDATGAMLAFLEVERDARRKKYRYYRVFPFLVGTFMLALSGQMLSSRFSGLWAPIFIVALSLGLVAYIWSMTVLSPRHQSVVSAWSKLSDIRAVGPLLDVVNTQHEDTRELVEAALTRLLPRLREEDHALLNDGQHAVLYYTLTKSSNEAFVHSILYAVQMVGDGRGLESVQSMALGAGMVTSERVRDYARACVPILADRREKEQITQTLLRPTNTPEEALLRPAQGTGESDAELLLRPSSAGNDDPIG